MSSRKSFTFLVLAYNHQDYIIEHLESIKYLVENYASEIDVSIVINDDSSNDKTVSFVETWLELNSELFFDVVTIFNEENIGTCKSIINMLGFVKTQACKLTASDDVYSFENIFEYAFLEENVSILSGIALNIIDGVIYEDKKDTFNYIVTDVLYKKSKLATRFKLLSNNNAPNIIYNLKYLKDSRLLSFLNEYDVIEDWPIQVSISRLYPETRFSLKRKVFVYYRRTKGSTYLVAKGRFYEDKCKLYRDLIDKEENLFFKFLLKSRYHCFNVGNRSYNKIFNAAFYYYLISIILKIKSIYFELNDLDLKFSEHKKHYDYLKVKSEAFYSNCSDGSVEF